MEILNTNNWGTLIGAQNIDNIFLKTMNKSKSSVSYWQ